MSTHRRSGPSRVHGPSPPAWKEPADQAPPTMHRSCPTRSAGSRWTWRSVARTPTAPAASGRAGRPRRSRRPGRHPAGTQAMEGDRSRRPDPARGPAPRHIPAGRRGDDGADTGTRAASGQGCAARNGRATGAGHAASTDKPPDARCALASRTATPRPADLSRCLRDISVRAHGNPGHQPSCATGSMARIARAGLPDPLAEGPIGPFLHRRRAKTYAPLSRIP